jgi:uncharacterized protein DUF3306
VSGDESFLERWARRKRAAANNVSLSDATSASDDPCPTDSVAHSAASETKRSDAAPASESDPLPDFDLTKLPSLDSITAETDIRAFLLPGVPAELSRAALRRAWSADPAIRDFVGLADYDWDFTKEGAMPGFGSLEMTDDLRRRVSEMVGRSLAPDEHAPSQLAGAGDQTAAVAREISGDVEVPAGPVLGSDRSDAEMSNGESALDQTSSRNCEEIVAVDSVYVASQRLPEASAKVPEPALRRHGRALPT